MRFLWNDKYFRICVYITITALFIFTVGLVIFNIDTVVLSFGRAVEYVLKVTAPFVVALIAVMFLNNIVKFYEKRLGVSEKGGFKKRTKATAAAYITVAVVVGIICAVAAFKLNARDIETLAESIYTALEGFEDLFVVLKVKLAEFGILETADFYIEEVVSYLTNFLRSGVSNIAATLSKTGSWAINIVIGLTIAFYLLSDKYRIIHYCGRICDVFLPEKASENVKMFFSDLANVFSGYISGQVTDAVILALLVTVCFTIIGIPYAPIIGIITGFSNLIPYVGAIVAFVLSVVLGFVSGVPIRALYAAITVLVLQQIDSIVIVPRVVGKSVELHPALVLIGLAVFGNMFGIVGMVFAVPITALIKMYLIKFYRHFEAKKFS